MSTSAKAKYHHGALRDALIAATIEASEELGEVPSLREVARRAGVSHAAAYNHFRSRKDLLRAVALTGFGRLEAVLAEFAHRDDATVEDVAAAYVRLADERRFEFSMMFDRELCLPKGEEDALEHAGRACEERLREFLHARHGLVGDELARAGFAALSCMHGAATLMLQTPAVHAASPEELQRMARSAVSFLALGRGFRRS